MVAFFLSPDTNSHIFDDNPLLKAPYDRLPYYAIGLLSRESDYPDIICTGAPISPTVILTAAHCLYDRQTLKWSDQLYYFPTTAVRDGGEPIKAESYIIPKEYIVSLKSTSRDEIKWEVFDFGVIILDRALNDSYASVFSVSHNQPATPRGNGYATTTPSSPAFFNRFHRSPSRPS